MLAYKEAELQEKQNQYEEEWKAKRRAQKDLGLFRSSSAELCRDHEALKKEIADFRDNKKGYIWRSEHQKLVEENEQLKSNFDHLERMNSCWKSQCGRF